jgi:hypothetical protein
MMNTIYCPYCGAPMEFRILGIASHTFTFVCPTCKARSPETIGQDQETTIMLAQKRMPNTPRLFQIEDFSGDLIPTVIWVELRNAEPVAGVWQQSYYVMEDGSVLDDPKSEIINNPGKYNREFRFWDSYPDKRIRDEEPWI